MRRNPMLEAALNELRPYGIRPTVTHGGKHLRLRWATPHRVRVTTVAISGSDWRGERNKRAEIRRMLREDGYSDATP
jgi:hypothetical protein